MLEFYFSDYCYLISYFLIVTYQWLFFVKNNFFNVRVKNSSTDKTIKTNFIKKLNYKTYINWILVSLCLLLLINYLVYGEQQLFWWNHLRLVNFNLFIVFYLNIFLLGFFIFIKFLPTTNINYSIDYFFSLGNLIVLLLLIFFSNTIYTFLFLLELNSSFIFYKFVVSKFWFKKNKNNTQSLTDKFNRVMPKFYLNMLFFQYWVTFFSSTLIIYSLINLQFIYGSSEWIFVEYLSQLQNQFFFSPNWIFYSIIWFSFFLGLFLKIGLTPLHLFKIEVYKGLPFISIFFYTIFYFLVFFLFFIILIFNYMYSVTVYWWLILFSMLLFGGIYILVLFFDVNYVKAFFAYSTIINSYSLFCIILIII